MARVPTSILRHKVTMISVRRPVRRMVAELPRKVRSYAKPSPCGLYYPRPATSDGMKPFVEVEILSPPPRVSVAAAFLDGLSADAIDDHVSWSERLQDREAALQREIEKQAARDAAASWAWP